MRGATRVCVVLLCFFNLTVDTGSALRCYSCTAPIGQRNDCERNVKPNTVATTYCQYGYTTCMTLLMHNTITRACAQSNVCQIYQHSPGFVGCSTCVTDLCNNSSTVSSFVLPSWLFLLLYVSFKIIVY